MTLEQIASALWRARLLFVAGVAACVAVVVAITLSLPKSYDASATLYVGVGKQVDESLAFDTALGEQLARTYTNLAANPNVATEVAARLDGKLTRKELQERMSFAPVERTQLLEITAMGPSPEAAKSLANTYAQTFVDRVERQFDRGETQSKISLNEPAAAPSVASRPNPPLYIGLGGILSIILVAGALVLRDRLDDRLRVADHAEDALGRAIVARVPEVDGRRGARAVEVKDAFRLLRTNVDFTDGRASQVVMVTSPSAGDGKSTVAARMALTAIADGERVAIIESDLRRPGLAAALARALPGGSSLERGTGGLTNYLVGVAGVDDVVVPQPSLPGLAVVWSGPLPPNPSSLLRSRRLVELLDHLRLHYDRVIIDTPPVSVGADASVIVPRADGTLVVVDLQRTRRPVAQAGLAQLEKAGARILGLVLNRAGTADVESYGYYGGFEAGLPADTAGEPARVPSGSLQ
jgi:capsular exopolysaccharide synthesis family protein